ncbi:MAG: thrombospondin type 3 repeat-containing protein [Patescibacteria group bacterium]
MPPTNLPTGATGVPEKPTLSQPPTFTGVPPKHSGKGKYVTIVLIVIIAIAVGGAAYAYMQKIGPFSSPPYNENSMASDIFQGIAKIKTAGYSLALDVMSQPREADAKSFTSSVPGSSAKLEAYKRDQDRARDIQDLLSKLRSYQYKSKTFPQTLQVLPDVADIKIDSYKYTRRDAGTDYNLSVTFETPEAAASIRKYMVGTSSRATGNTIVFNNDSSNYINLPAKPSNPSLIDVSSLQDYLQYVPAAFKANVVFSGASEKKADNTVNGRIRLVGSTDYNDINIAIDAEAMKVDDNVYFMVHKFPAFFFDISKLKEKWVKMTPEDLAGYGARYLGGDADRSQQQIQETKERVIEGIKLFLTIADTHRALMPTRAPVKEQLNGHEVYRYELQFNKNTMAEFYKDLTSQFEQKFVEKNPIKFSEATYDYLKSPEFDEVFDYFRSNTILTLWANGDGIPEQVRYSVRMVPADDAKNKDYQVRFTSTLALIDINQPIHIEAPAGSMTLDDAVIAMSGVTKEEYALQKQERAVSSVRAALSTYKQITGEYPLILSDLTKAPKDLKKAPPTTTVPTGTALTPIRSYYGDENSPILKVVPSDSYLKQPFSYKKVGKDYELKYSVTLPSYVPGTISYTIFSRNYSYSSTRTTSSYMMKYVNGLNTANETALSAEAALAAKVDQDKDGLPDTLEAYLGTRKDKKDTDGDGHSDASELDASTNPNGPGTLKREGSGGLFF